jgi:hypothetical protein|tara:strand:+ start:727 stop:1203 length:477 start_codon:yes stop_codon:yes gene_type:complete
MAASAWQLYNSAKKYIGNGTIVLGAGVFKMVLASASSNASTFTLSAYGGGGALTSVTNEIAATGGYVTGGKNLVPATAQWTVGASAKQMKYTMSTVGIAFTASGAPLTDIKFALLRNSTGAAAGKLLCFCQLSSANFTVASPNTLTVLPAATGIFTLT